MADTKAESSKVANVEFAPTKIASKGWDVGGTAPETVYVEYINGDVENTRVTKKQPVQGFVLVQEGDQLSQHMLDTLGVKKSDGD